MVSNTGHFRSSLSRTRSSWSGITSMKQLMIYQSQRSFSQSQAKTLRLAERGIIGELLINLISLRSLKTLVVMASEGSGEKSGPSKACVDGQKKKEIGTVNIGRNHGTKK